MCEWQTKTTYDMISASYLRWHEIYQYVSCPHTLHLSFKSTCISQKLCTHNTYYQISMVYINLVKSVRLGKIYFIMVLSTSIKTEKQRNALNKLEGKFHEQRCKRKWKCFKQCNWYHKPSVIFSYFKIFFFSITEIIIFGLVSPNIIFLMLKYCYTNMMVTTSYNYKKN